MPSVKGKSGGSSALSTVTAFGRCRSVAGFQKMGRIGEGTYGYVYRAIDKSTSEVVALKRVILHNERQDGFPLTSLREIKTLMRCRHKNIVELRDVVVGVARDAVFLVFEYCEHDLSVLVKSMKTSFKESEIKCLIQQLLAALEFTHKNWIVHRDIKLSNLLYNSRGLLKLADFGLARTVSCPVSENNLTQTVVTLWYRAPELLLGATNYLFGVDLWSVGCILGELLLNQPLLPGENELDQIRWIFHLLGCPNSRIWPGVEALPMVVAGQVDLTKLSLRYQYNNVAETFPALCDTGIELLHALLAYDPGVRIGAQTALRHEYFQVRPFPQHPDMMPTFPSEHDS